MQPTENIVGNVYDKYETRNPIARYLMSGFINAVTGFYNQLGPDTVLEVGCGEGRLIHLLIEQAAKLPRQIVGCDLSIDYIEPDLNPAIQFEAASIYKLPFHDDQFELVICCEVLEHIENPAAGLSELARVAKQAVLISTPREPLWRILNMARGKYLANLGNTPGHIQHFSRAELIAMAQQHLTLLGLRNPMPWTVLLGRPIA